MEGACINIKLIIGNRESGTGNWFIVLYLRYTSFCLFLFSQHVWHQMILKINSYLSSYNEYYEVSVEGAYINMKLRIGNRESGTGNWFLVPCSLFEKTSRIFQNCKIGNRESGTGNRKLVPYFGIFYLCFKSANRE